MLDTAIVWFRNDLRLHDNEILYRAIKNHHHIIGVYCFDPRHYQTLESLKFKKTGAKRTQFLIQSLKNLRDNFSRKNGTLIIRKGKPETVIPELVEKYTVKAVYAQQEIASEETAVERNLAQNLGKTTLHLIWGRTLYHVDDAPFEPQNTPTVSKEFRITLTKNTEVRPLIPTPETINSPNISTKEKGRMPSLRQLGFDEGEIKLAQNIAYKGGETKALKRLNYYTFETQLLTGYKFTRNRSLGQDYSSKLSPYLAVGAISPRQIYWQVKEYEKDIKKNISTWWLVFEVIWRDFFTYQTLKYANKMFFVSGIKDREVDFNEDEELFGRWKSGQTGIPFVDAHMRELLQTGFMSNRGRVNCASFLSRDYKINWTWGAAWFETHLLDYDVASNWLNWNTQATEIWYTNPVWQGLKYDKKGEYVKHWLPQLKDIDSVLVQAPWLLDSFPKDYPKPIEVYKKWNWALGRIKSAYEKEKKSK